MLVCRAVEVAVSSVSLPTSLRRIAVASSARSRLMQAVGDQGQEVRVFARLRLFGEGVQFLGDVVVLAALGQRPDDVGVGDVGRAPGRRCRGPADCA